jgi:hypothetical protein
MMNFVFNFRVQEICLASLAQSECLVTFISNNYICNISLHTGALRRLSEGRCTALVLVCVIIRVSICVFTHLAAIGKTGAAVGTQAFTPIQNNLGKRCVLLLCTPIIVLTASTVGHSSLLLFAASREFS